MQHYQRLLQGVAVPVEGQPLRQALPPGYGDREVVPYRYEPLETGHHGFTRFPPVPALPTARSSPTWLSRCRDRLTPPVQFFCLCAIVSMGVVVWSRSQPHVNLPTAGATPTVSHTKPVPQKFSQPSLPLVPRPPQK
jgi:hypothetical protein